MGEPSIDTVTATYNEIDSYAADWISNLASAGHVAPGRVQPQAQAFLEAVIDMLTATDEPTTNLTKATPSGRLITLLLSPAPFA